MKIINAGNINATMQIVMQYAKQGSTTVWAKANHGSHYELWRKLRQTIKYTPDPEGKELIRSVEETLKGKKADCEDFAIMISAIMLHKKIAHSFRIYDYGRGWEHIALVLADGTVIDPVNDIFNVEPEYVKVKDYYHNKVVSLGNLPQFQTKGKNQVTINNEIIQLLESGKKLSDSEIDFMYQYYEGSGGQGNKGATGEGLLYEFYTPDYICKLMWELAEFYGYDGGAVLEPSCATGRLITPAKDYSKVVGFEINPYSAKIAELKHKGCKVYNDYFETAFLEKPRLTSRLGKKGELKTWLPEYPFSMVIGNPPYGIYKNSYSTYFPFEKKLAQIETVFYYWGLKMLKKDGLLVYISSSNFMRTGNKYQYAKEVFGGLADFVDAYRLPTVFKFTEVPTDILILRRK